MAFLYPWGNTQQLNLDWILKKIKELETGGGADLEEVANALIALTHRTTTQYQRWDYCFYNGKLYRALVNTTGAFAPGDWREVLLGDDVSVLTRLINALNTDNIDNASTVSGTTASDALDNLNSAITSLETKLNTIAVSTEAGLKTTTTCFRATANIALGSTGVTIEQYARGIVISSDGSTGCVIAVGYNGNVYTAFLSSGVFVKAQIYDNNTATSTLTMNTSFLSSSGILCKKSGNLVVLTGTIVTNADATTDDILLSGFPIPPSAIEITGTIIEATDTTLRGKAGRYRIKTDGTLVAWYNTWPASASGSTILFNASYYV